MDPQRGMKFVNTYILLFSFLFFSFSMYSTSMFTKYLGGIELKEISWNLYLSTRLIKHLHYGLLFIIILSI